MKKKILRRIPFYSILFYSILSRVLNTVLGGQAEFGVTPVQLFSK